MKKREIKSESQPYLKKRSLPSQNSTQSSSPKGAPREGTPVELAPGGFRNWVDFQSTKSLKDNYLEVPKKSRSGPRGSHAWPKPISSRGERYKIGGRLKRVAPGGEGDVELDFSFILRWIYSLGCWFRWGPLFGLRIHDFSLRKSLLLVPRGSRFSSLTAWRVTW
jgi:hypothetical protein